MGVHVHACMCVLVRACMCASKRACVDVCESGCMCVFLSLIRVGPVNGCLFS